MACLNSNGYVHISGIFKKKKTTSLKKLSFKFEDDITENEVPARFFLSLVPFQKWSLEGPKCPLVTK